MAFSNITDAPEVLVEYTPKGNDKATIGGKNLVRYRVTKTTEYTGMTKAGAIAAVENVEGDLAGNIQVDGAAVSPTLHVDGFTAATGLVWPGTGVTISGDGHTYRVAELATIAANEVDLLLTENYIEAGTILVDGGGQTGVDLDIDGFTNATGYVRQGTTLTISGVTGTYTVEEEAAIVGSAASLTITPTLASTPSDGAAVTLSHPADGTAVDLAPSGVEGTAVRSGSGEFYAVRIKVDYYLGVFQEVS